jgi:hypothetical protein
VTADIENLSFEDAMRNHSFLIVQGRYDTIDKYKLWTIFA